MLNNLYLKLDITVLSIQYVDDKCNVKYVLLYIYYHEYVKKKDIYLYLN